MTEEYCRSEKGFGPIKSCGDWCCKNGQECADAGTSTCCPVETPKKCGSACCAMCNADKTGCCMSDKTCGSKCCPDGQECKNGNTCCDIIDKSKCPNGETMITSNGCEICKCESQTSCPDGQVPVINYVDGIGACGEICCTKKEGYTTYSSEGCSLSDDYCTIKTYSDYQAVGGVNGSCCGGNYGGVEENTKAGDVLYTSSRIQTYKVRNNNGYYCDLDTSEMETSKVVNGTETGDVYSGKKVHLSDSECGSYTLTEMFNSSQIFTSPDGDPCSNGTSKVWECSYWSSDDGFGTCPLPEEAYEDAMNSYGNGS